ncbi:hypothetical protein C8P63_1012 [Melghirimyces profundicolus]|uniref:Uncharacterized protein n=1 Tax=Melghirimyces profundicolus TaxID=1242148 RepID=A0A2T6C938_9BACL|nr:hypothetical protein C8P63_1012 [Melghirimyces profundicolus]
MGKGVMRLRRLASYFTWYYPFKPTGPDEGPFSCINIKNLEWSEGNHLQHTSTVVGELQMTYENICILTVIILFDNLNEMNVFIERTCS